VEVVLARDGALVSIRAVVGDLNQDGVDRLVLFAGAAFQDINYEFRSRSDLRKLGVAVAHVETGSAAEAADLRRDDVVLSVAGKPATDAPTFWRALANAGNGDRLLLVIRRPSTFDSATRTVSLVTDRVWDPSRLLQRTVKGWIDAPAPKPKNEPKNEGNASRPASSPLGRDGAGSVPAKH
jgi:C-terminal processing protease CtpA/Prc